MLSAIGDTLKSIFGLLLIPVLAFGAQGAALTAEDTTKAVTFSLALQKDTQALFAFAYAVDKLVKSGYTYQVNFTTTPIQGTMTAQQQQDIVNYYQALKLQLQTDFGKLP